MPDQKQTPANQAAIKQQVKTVAQPAKTIVKPITQQPAKPITNVPTTSANPANAELPPQSISTENIGEKPTTVTEDSVSKKEESVIDITKALEQTLSLKEEQRDYALKSSEKDNLQSEKMPAEKPKLQLPTQGKVVIFYCEENDDICRNRVIDTLPATVVLVEELKLCLSVHTLDSRDPIVLRKEIPHKSIAPKDSEDNVLKPYWDWPIISK